MRRPALLALTLGWALLPALPALARGELLGHPYTDLYPSVWSLWAQGLGLPVSTPLLGHPGGMGWYAPSPIKGLLSAFLLPLIGLPATWNLLLLAARAATVYFAGRAAEAWGARPDGALLAAALYGCAPFFHGYAVEGIVEGTDGWTLALWALCIGQGRWAAAALALGLTVLSSWYLGLCACLLAVLAAIFADRRAAYSLGGLLLVAPAILRFAAAFPAAAPLPEALRAAMGASPWPAAPGLLPGLQPFAMTAWIGLLPLGLLAWKRPREALLAGIPGLLSLGMGPWYALPVLSAMRFPYRWHAATLALLALGLARAAPRKAGWIALLIVIEGLCLSPIEPLIPGAPAAIPALYATAPEGALLAFPGPLARPPGEINPGRPRARYLLYFQTAHGQPSPWVPDFNSVGVGAVEPAWLSDLRSWDPEERRTPLPITAEMLLAMRRDGLRTVILERAPLRDARADALRDALLAAGATLEGEDKQRIRLGLPR
jgi:hypothetical protein